MQVILDMRAGPMAGIRKEIELGASAEEALVLGREPGPGGFLLDGDPTVSRKHGSLRRHGPRVIYENLSSNGTVIDRKVILGRAPLEPGASLKIGLHDIEIRYESGVVPGADAVPGNLFQRGPLAKPVVRAALALYLVGLVGVALLLTTRGDGASSSSAARELYVSRYLAEREDLEAAERQGRLALAELLTQELEAQIRSEHWLAARRTCRRLMAIDGDPHSPIYRFAAHRLADLAGRS